jgi:hypothetical protein
VCSLLPSSLVFMIDGDREDLRSCFLGLTITSLSVATAIKIVADMSVSNLNLRFTVLVHRTVRRTLYI